MWQWLSHAQQVVPGKNYYASSRSLLYYGYRLRTWLSIKAILLLPICCAYHENQIMTAVVVLRGWAWEGNAPPQVLLIAPPPHFWPFQIFSLADLCLYIRVIIVYYMRSCIASYRVYNAVRDIFISEVLFCSPHYFQLKYVCLFLAPLQPNFQILEPPLPNTCPPSFQIVEPLLNDSYHLPVQIITKHSIRIVDSCGL